MNSQQLEYVLTIAEMKSFSKAARKLYVTQPSLSQYIMKIEEQLGTQLFNRSTTPITLTESGKIYVEYAARIRALEERLGNELADIENVKIGSLKIGASTFRASCLLSKSVAEFSRRFPGIEVRIVEGSTEPLLQMVKNSELDVMLTTSELEAGQFHTEILAKERLYAAVPQGSAINEGLSEYSLTAADIRAHSLKSITVKPLPLSRFAGEKFVLTDRGEYSEDSLQPLFDEAGFKPETALRVRTLETLLSFINAGFGISLIPDSLIIFGNYAEQPIYYPLESGLSERGIYLVSRKNGCPTRASKEYSLTLKQLVDIGTWRV